MGSLEFIWLYIIFFIYFDFIWPRNNYCIGPSHSGASNPELPDLITEAIKRYKPHQFSPEWPDHLMGTRSQHLLSEVLRLVPLPLWKKWICYQLLYSTRDVLSLAMMSQSGRPLLSNSSLSVAQCHSQCNKFHPYLDEIYYFRPAARTNTNTHTHERTHARTHT